MLHEWSDREPPCHPLRARALTAALLLFGFLASVVLVVNLVQLVFG